MANAMNQDAEDTSNPDINNINDQLDDSDVEDDPIWSAGQNFNSQQAGGFESNTGSGQGTETGQSGAGVSGEGAGNTAGFSPENGGEWNAGNLRNIPTDKDFVIRSLDNTANGRSVLSQRGIPSRFNSVINDLIKAIKRVNSSRLTPDQKAAVFNGGSADNYNNVFRKDIDTLRLYGILPGNA